MQDANWNVVAVATPAAVIQERYAYSPYGVPVFLSGTFTVRTSSNFAWERLYCGYRHSATVEIYNVRHRDLGALLGCWMCRDPIAYKAGSPNLYEYVSSSPTRATDPSGLYRDCAWENILCVRFCMARPKRCFEYPENTYTGKLWRWAKYNWCETTCQVLYRECVAEQGARDITEMVFGTVDAALQWMAANPGLVTIGAVIIIAGVAYIVVTGGSGALALAPIAALA